MPALDLRDVDLNLHHVIELNLDVEAIRRVVEASGLRVWALSGGWCDSLSRPPRIDDTFRSAERQVAAARQFGVDLCGCSSEGCRSPIIRLPVWTRVCGNLRELSDRYPDVRFVFENHDGVSLDPAICRDVLDRVGRPNIRMNFDPINFERHGVDSRRALDVVCRSSPTHLKGLRTRNSASSVWATWT